MYKIERKTTKIIELFIYIFVGYAFTPNIFKFVWSMGFIFDAARFKKILLIIIFPLLLIGMFLVVYQTIGLKFNKNRISIKKLGARYSILLLVFVLWFCLSIIQQLLFNVGVRHSLRSIYLYFIITIGALWLEAHLDYRNKNFIKNLFFIALVFGAINFIPWLYETFTGDYIVADRGKWLREGKNIFKLYLPVGYYTNTNNVGLFTYILLFIICINFITFENKAMKWVIGFLGVIDVFIMLSTGSELLYLTLLVVTFLLFILHTKRKTALYLIIVGILMMMCFVIILIKRNINKIEVGSARIRSNLIVDGIHMFFMKSYGIGLGFSGFDKYVGVYGNTDGMTNPHNFIIELLVSAGGIIFILLVCLYFKGMETFFNQSYYLQKDSDKQKISLYSFVFFAGFLIVSNSPSFCFGMPFIWLYIVMMKALYEYVRDNNIVGHLAA